MTPHKAVKKLVYYLVEELLLLFQHETKCKTKQYLDPSIYTQYSTLGQMGLCLKHPIAPMPQGKLFSPIQSSPFASSLKTHKLQTQCQRLSLWTKVGLTVHYCYWDTGINQRETHKAVLGGKVLTCISCFSGKEASHCLLSNLTDFVLKFTIPSFIHILAQIYSLWNIFLNKKLSSEGRWEVRVKYFNYCSLFCDWTSQ